MATEKVEQQLKEIDTEGPLTKYVNKRTVWGIIAIAFFVFAVWEMRPGAEATRNIPRPKQSISDKGENEIPAHQTPKQTSNFSNRYPDGTGVRRERPNGSTASQSMQNMDPKAQLRQVRMQRILEYAFKTHEEKEEPKQEAGNPKQPDSAPSAKSPEPGLGSPLYSIPEGTIVPATLASRINGEQSGFFDAVVSEDVYIQGTRHIVIPQGARALGESQRVTGFGTRRLALLMHKIQIYPQMENHCDIQIDTPSLDQAGTAGLTGTVNNHTLSLVLSAGAVALIQGASMGLTYGGTYGIEQILVGNMASSSAQVTERLLDRFTNRPASITIPEGSRIKLIFLKDTPSSCEVNQ